MFTCFACFGEFPLSTIRAGSAPVCPGCGAALPADSVPGSTSEGAPAFAMTDEERQAIVLARVAEAYAAEAAENAMIGRIFRGLP